MPCLRAIAISTLLVLCGGLRVGFAADAADAPDAQQMEDVAFKAQSDGSTEHYVLLYPKGFKADEPHGMLICLHGHGSDRWQFAKAAINEAKGARDAAAAHNMLFVSPDYRAKTSWMGPNAEADMLQIIEELKKKFNITKVVVAGGSMGASSALTFAAIHPNLVDGVIALNGTANHLEYENFQEAISESFGGPKAAIPQEYKKRSAEYWPERLKMPIAVTVGGQDKSVPPGPVMRLAAILKKLQPNVLVIERPEGGHSTNYEDTKAACDFVLDKVLPAPAK